MNILFKLISIFLLSLGMASCVKNEPFLKAYSVPEVFPYENTDSSAKARVIMMHGMQHYLATSVNTTLNQDIVDSLWANRGKPFTEVMVPDFTYADSILNRMTNVTLQAATADADSIKAYADSVVANSRYYAVAGSNGMAGWQMQTTPVSAKRLFSKDGKAYKEVWANAMLGAMALKGVFAQLNSAAASKTWELAYDYTGFPMNYDPAKNYETAPIPRDRPLSIAGCFSEVPDSLRLGSKIYESFRRGKTALYAGDSRIAGTDIGIIYFNLERGLAAAAAVHLDAAKKYTDIAGKLNELSKAYGFIIALKYRYTISLLSAENYWLLRSFFDDENFYTLVQDPSYKSINAAMALLTGVYGL
ncbi:DUF4856 domain-containing protein [Niabella aquatica]